MTFQSTHPALARALAARDYSIPTAVQSAVLDVNAPTRDLLVSAQTGSGKTVAFGLAIATTLLGPDERFEHASEPTALIIAPTRELALQVQRELSWLYAETGARVVTCVGGMDVRAEARQLGLGAHIVVGTPGRLRDHLERRRLDLTKLKAIVLDEADEMLDLGFREDLEFILDATPESRQTLMFSATMPREIETLARRYQRDAARIETRRRDEQHADIEYCAIRVAPTDIENAVVNVLRLHEMRATLVFCATREAVKRMHARLVERGFFAVALSGELTQGERTQALQAMRDGRARVLVATDVAARGLDLPDLALVIHADLPNDRETLLHRSGRTGRAGKKGKCTLIVPYNRRRKAEALLAAARLKVTWRPAPTADEIRARDQERFLADSIFTETPTEDELVLARTLQAARTAEEIALALVRIHRAQLPAPEDLAEDTGPPPRDDRRRMGRERFERRPDHGPAAENTEYRQPRERRQNNRDCVWFRLNIGRERNADPRWLVPLICQAGGITKAEIGAIKIFDRDTRFEIVAEFADAFADSVRTNKSKKGHISRVGTHTSADDAAVTEAINELTPASRESVAPVGNSNRRNAAETTPPNERSKSSWRDRVHAKGRPHRKGGGKGSDAQGMRPRTRPQSTPGASQPAKFDHKKKNRARPSGAKT
jgi:ATP-dependent RNA helicase DeaD